MTGPISKPAPLNPWLVLAAFIVSATVMILRDRMGGGPLFGDTDDAMRMVVVRDFLAGQGWYDLVQHRLNTPYGGEMHWSRLVDAPIALLILVLRPFLGAAADNAAGFAWPLLLFAVLLYLSGKLANRLVGPEGVLPAVVLPVLSPALTTEFTPGRIDHHNVVILLTLAIVWTTIEAFRRPRFAIAAGVLCATALAIATESLPFIVAAVLVFALMWVIEPQRRHTVMSFGLAFAGATLVHLAIALPPSRWLVPACDMISPFYAGLALVAGMALTAVALLPTPKTPLLRLLLVAAFGLSGLAGILAIYPDCLRGPYAAIDPYLMTNWLNRITEAKPWSTSLVELPAYAIAVGIPTMLALAVIVVRLVRVPHERAEWLALLAFFGFAVLIMLLQVRGARLAIAPALPAAAWLIVAARHRFIAAKGVLTVLGLLASWLVFAGVVLVITTNVLLGYFPGPAAALAQTRANSVACLLPSAFADLAGLPPERILTPIDLGAHMLLETPHSVVSAPYHRNQQGVRDTFDFFNLPIDRARNILEQRGIALVVTCPAMPEMSGLPDRAPDSFVDLSATGQLPAWLEDVSLDGPLKVYAVQPR